MKTKANHRQRILMMAASMFVLTVMSTSVQAQWTGPDGSNRIYYNAGNVGVGTSTPAANLQVESSSSTTFRIVSTGDNVAYERIKGSTGDWYAGLFGSADYSIGDITNSNATYLTVKRTSGNIGIGTTSPAYPFQAYNASANNYNIQSQRGSGAGIGLWTSTAIGALYTTNNFPLELGVNGSSDIAINTSHNVGIGTTSPSVNLEVAGTFRSARSGVAGQYIQLSGGDSSGTYVTVVPDSGNEKPWIFNHAGSASAANTNYQFQIAGTTKLTIDNSGNVSLSGTINAKYQDVAEWVSSSEQLAVGTVVVLDSTKSNEVIASTVAYDTRVAGVISAQPGIALGEKGEGKVLVATTGRVKIKVDATKSPIRIGDLLVTSDIPGVAMKSEPVNLGGVQIHRPGTLIGKALEPLAKGSGEILVLLSLQ